MKRYKKGRPIIRRRPLHCSWLRRWLRGLRNYEGGILPFERLYRAASPAFGHGCRHRIGEDVLLLLLNPGIDGVRGGFRRRLGNVEAAVHVGVDGTGEYSMDLYPLRGQQGA